jgi:hypothetical protein
LFWIYREEVIVIENPMDPRLIRSMRSKEDIMGDKSPKNKEKRKKKENKKTPGTPPSISSAVNKK